MTNSPFHDPERNPLPDANDIEANHIQQASEKIALYSIHQEADARGPSPQMKQDIKRLRNAFIWLIVVGAILGGIMSIGAAYLLRRFGLLETPKSRQESSLIQKHFNS